ncbi:MAG: TonB-dependent receptor [Bryobacteraceae bacterium]
MSKHLFLFAAALVPTLWAAPPDADGMIAGKIVDPAGAMIHQATITVTNLQTKEIKEAHPHLGGLYRVTELAAGTYEVRVTADGFRPFANPRVSVAQGETVRVDATLRLGKPDDEVTVAAEQKKDTSSNALFGALPMVEAATLRQQTLEEVPSNVSLITAADIRRFGYRTLAEALQSVRGFYMTSDRIYGYGGVRGISIPGDYNSRFLVMVNGHAMTEPIYNSANFFGQDFGLDMDLVQRIEIIRGPSSALYGSNGMLTTINVVTKSPVDAEKYRVSQELGSFNERKLSFSTSQDLGKGVNLLLSGSGFNSGSKSLFIPQFNTPENNFGRINRTDIDRGYHTFANLIVGEWRFTAYFNSRERQPPVAWADALFGTHGNRVRDSRNFAEAAWQRTLSNGATVRWNLTYDNYKYFDRFYYQGGDAAVDRLTPGNEDVVEDRRTSNHADWVTSQASYSTKLSQNSHIGTTTAGVQARFDVSNYQSFISAVPQQVILSRVVQPDRSAGFFIQQEIEVTPQLKAYLGGRFDISKNYQNNVAPQVSLVYQPDKKTALKAVLGRPYRNPSAFEQFWEDRSPYLASGGLHSEVARTVEVSAERKITKTLSAVVNVYDYSIDRLIKVVYLDDSFQQYQNTGSYRSRGAEFEVNARPGAYQIDASWSLQRAYQAGTRQWLDNSPRHLGKFRFAAPLYRNIVHASASFYYMGTRGTRESGLVDPFWLADFNIVTTKLHRNFDLMAGVRNAFNKQYEDPVALFIDRIRRDGRTYYVKLIYNVQE